MAFLLAESDLWDGGDGVLHSRLCPRHRVYHTEVMKIFHTYYQVILCQFVRIIEIHFPFRYVIPLQLICSLGSVWGQLVLALEAFFVREWFLLQVNKHIGQNIS